MPGTLEEFSSILIIGGEGFLGHNLVLALLKHYPSATVYSLDLTQRYFDSSPYLPDEHSQSSQGELRHEFLQADLTDAQSLLDAFNKVKPQAVFHTASPWSGSSYEICHSVNVQGTINTINASQATGVKKLVYTSSAGVVFNGNHLINVDERLPIPKIGCDHYNTSKAKAEAIVLEANGKNSLLTCAIRPAGIFGPGDRQAIPGMIQVLKNRQDWIQIGDNKNLFDWTYVDNVVHGHILALEKLEERVPLEGFSTTLKPIFKTIKRRNLLTSGRSIHGVKNESEEEEEEGSNAEVGGTGEESIENLELIDLSDEMSDSVTRLRSTSSNSYNAIGWIQGKEDLIDLPLPAKRHRWDQWAPLSTQINRPTQNVPVAGEAFFITGGEPIFFWDFARYIWQEYTNNNNKQQQEKITTSNSNKQDKFKLIIPSFLALFLAFLSEFWSKKITGKPTLFTREKVRYTCVSKFHNIEKARVVLGYEPIVGVEQGIQKAVKWYILNESLEKTQNQDKKNN